MLNDRPAAQQKLVIEIDYRYCMLNATDLQTIRSLSLLRKTAAGERPVVLWLGAGVSKWAGLPSWKEIARDINRTFSRSCPSYDQALGKGMLSAGHFPELFELCSKADRGLYHTELAKHLTEATVAPLYLSFIEKLKTINPRYLVTTNADNLLEQHLPLIEVVERSDVERYTKLCQAKKSCLAKLHGSISAVESVAFTTSDYEKLKTDTTYIQSLRNIFTFSCVVFLGYGLQDEYVLKLLKDQGGANELFGTGPHFLVTSSPNTSHASIHSIQYDLNRHADHRSALRVLDYLIQSVHLVESLKNDDKPTAKANSQSAFYITDFHPPGTHNTSQTVTFGKTDVDTGLITNVGSLTIGLGWAAGELPSLVSHAMHDLLVGLLCFDKTYIPIDSLGSTIATLKEELFRALLESGSLGFIHREEEPAIIYAPGELIGNISAVTGKNADDTGPLQINVLIRRHIQPVKGKEAEFEEMVSRIAASVTIVRGSDNSVVPNMTQSALLMPKVSSMLGFGEALLPSQAPDWLKFPILRMAHLVQTSQVCQDLGIISTRLPFGGAALVSAAFGVNANDMFADQYASYIFSGSLQARLDDYIERNPQVLYSVLSFRDIQSGIDLRTQVVECLRSEEHAEFVSSVDAGLKKNLPFLLLEKAKKDMSLLLADGAISPTPAVWTAPSFSETSIRFWRDIARSNLLKLLHSRGANTSSPCLCGSGDTVAQCCLQALRT